MWRKKDLNKKNWCKLYPPIEKWTEPVLTTTDELTQNGKISKKVFLQDQSCEEFSKQVLDPRVIDLQAIIDSGMVIDPKTVARPLVVTDLADIEARQHSLGKKMYSYLLENQDLLTQKDIKS